MMYISSIFKALDYMRDKNPGFRVIHTFKSKSKHAGPEGVTHFMSERGDEIEIVGLRSYWWSTAIRPPGWTGILDKPKLLPTEDIGSEGETIRDDMIKTMEEYLRNDKDPNYIIVMKNGDIYQFKASRIVDYINTYQTWIHHRYYDHGMAAAGYPNRLAENVIKVAN